MKHVKVLLFASSLAAVAAFAVTPTPSAKSPAPRPTATASSSSAAASPAAEQLASPSEVAVTQATTQANQGPPPKPVLFLTGLEAYSTGGKNFVRRRYDVLNKSDYPADMFAAAPSLPPCGLNHNSSRTWVDFFDSTGKRLYGFCALSKPDDLGKIWIAFEETAVPPSYVYIELNDRQTNTKLKSNLADTTL